MKIEDAIKLLSRKKVYVGKKSKEIQTLLLSLGFTSEVGIVGNLGYPFIYISDDLNYSFEYDLCYFNVQDSYLEISSQEILDIKLDNFSIGDIVYSPKDKKIGKITYINEDGAIFCDITCNTNYNISMNSHYENGSKIGNMKSLILADDKQINIYNESIDYIQRIIPNGKYKNI